MSNIISAPRSTRQQYLRRLQAAILRHILYRGNVHADADRTIRPLPDGALPNTVGAAFSGLEVTGLIEAIGFERSGRESRHRGVSRVWRVCDQVRARGYLSALVTTGDDLCHF